MCSTPSGSAESWGSRPVGGGHKKHALAHGYSMQTPSGFKNVPYRLTEPRRVAHTSRRFTGMYAPLGWLFLADSADMPKDGTSAPPAASTRFILPSDHGITKYLCQVFRLERARRELGNAVLGQGAFDERGDI